MEWIWVKSALSQPHPNLILKFSNSHKLIGFLLIWDFHYLLISATLKKKIKIYAIKEKLKKKKSDLEEGCWGKRGGEE